MTGVKTWSLKKKRNLQNILHKFYYSSVTSPLKLQESIYFKDHDFGLCWQHSGWFAIPNLDLTPNPAINTSSLVL